MDIKEYEQMQPHVVSDGLVFLTPNQHCAWRVETLYTKEPDTIEWIGKMKPGETLFDVGACMGGYSLLAAKKGVIVHAFEPESQNFALLCRNIAINKLGELITPWPISISDGCSIDKFYVQSLMAGGSCSSYGEEVNFHLKPKSYAFHQGSISIHLDKFVDNHSLPDHVKIDVDGLEHKVISGMHIILKTVKSVLVEMNRGLLEHNKIFEIMLDKGLYPDLETAEKARRKEGAFENIGNVIFYRV